MARDRTDPGNFRNELPEVQGRVRPEPVNGHVLTSRLVPIVDRIRQLYTSFGIHSMRVFLVHIQWSGDRIGVGAPVEISRKEILPTPNVRDMNATVEVMRAFGLTEEGTVAVDKISAKYTEDDLMGRTPDLVDATEPRTSLRNVEFFWEVVENRPSNPQPVRRRYVPSVAPRLSRDSFQWTVVLTKQTYDRARDASMNRRAS